MKKFYVLDFVFTHSSDPRGRPSTIIEDALAEALSVLGLYESLTCLLADTLHLPEDQVERDLFPTTLGKRLIFFSKQELERFADRVPEKYRSTILSLVRDLPDEPPSWAQEIRTGALAMDMVGGWL